eukprot:Lankesteria_metandrocarpae@DN4772_c1_g1_i1.p1
MESEVDRVMKDAAALLGKPESAVNPFTEFFRTNWITSKSDLQNLSDEQWHSVGMPMALENVVRRTLLQISDHHSRDSSVAQAFPSTPATGFLPFDDSCTTAYSSSYDITSEISSVVTDPVESHERIVSCLKLLLQVVSNILKHPEDIQKRSLKVSNPTIAQKILTFAAAKRFLLGVGFQEESSSSADLAVAEGRLVLHTVYISRLVDAYTVVANALSALGVDVPPVQSKAFNPFASNITVSEDKLRFKAVLTESAQQQDEVRNELMQRREAHNNQQSTLHEPPPLDPKIFDISELGQMKAALRQLDVAEENLHLDDDIIGREDFNLSALVQMMTGGQTFHSRAKTELDEIRRRKTFQLSTLRVLFPDKSVLQLTFDSCTSICKVYDAVKPFLAPSVASAVDGWYLYESPPLRRFKPQDTLKQAGLMPMAMVHFSLEDRTAHKGGPFLKNPPKRPPPPATASDPPPPPPLATKSNPPSSSKKTTRQKRKPQAPRPDYRIGDSSDDTQPLVTEDVATNTAAAVTA